MADLIPVGVSIKEQKAILNAKFATLDAGNASETAARTAGDASLQQQITAEQLARIAADTAHAASTTAHSADHITYSGAVTGQTNVKGALDTLKQDMNAIVSTPNDGNAEITVARQSLDGSAPTTLGDRLDKMEAKQLAAEAQEMTIVHGLNHIDTDTDSDLQVRIKGVTRTNIFGKDGNCDDTSKWIASNVSLSLDTANALYGTNAFKVTGLSTYGEAQYSVTTESSKYYIFVIDIKNGTTDGASCLVLSGSHGTDVNTTSYQPSYKKFVGDDSTSHVGVGFAGAAGTYGYIDGARLFEISATDYAAIDTMTADQIAAKWPYVDDVKSLENPVIEVPGKNLLPPFTEWTLPANAVVTEPYKLTLNATALYQSSSVTLNVLPSKAYTISAGSLSTNALFSVRELDANGNSTLTVDGAGSNTTFTTLSTTRKITFAALNYVTASGAFTWTEPMLVLGDSSALPPSFVEASPKYMYVLTTLAGNPITGVYDTFDSVTNTVTRRFKTGVLLSGYTWASETDMTGFKVVKANSAISDALDSGENIIGVKYDGKILTDDDQSVTSWASADRLRGSAGTLYLAIDDDDSGWGEDFIPSADEIKAMVEYGWKLNNGTFGTPYNGSGTKTWTRWDATDNSAAVTTVPTTLATGYPGYTLSYELAQSVTEAVQVEGALALVEGGNQIELGEGVFDRVKVTPVASGSNYIINLAAVPSSCPANRVDKIIQIDRGLDKDNKWVITNNPSDAYGNERAQIAGTDFDDTKEYYLTFIALDKYSMTANAVDADVEYQSSDKSVLAQMVQKQADIETNVTININAIAELYKRVIALGG